METPLQVSKDFIERHTHFPTLIEELRNYFSNEETLVPKRHHHDFPNAKSSQDSTLLLMPAWNPKGSAGVKIVTVSPENSVLGLPSIQGTYIYLDPNTGIVKAIMDAKSLTTKRTAAASAMASEYLSAKNAKSLLMIGTGALAWDLVQAHRSVRNLEEIYVWGRNFEKVQNLCNRFKKIAIQATPIKSIAEKISEVDIVSCATLSKTPLVLGEHIRPGQHIDLVGSYKTDMREADDLVITKGSIYLDTYQGGLKESGDIVIPLENGILVKEAIKSDLFELCSGKKPGRIHAEEITVFKSVGHAIEDLAAADYYYKQFSHA